MRRNGQSQAEKARGQMRALQKVTSGIKDAAKHSRLRRIQDLKLLELLDQIELAHVKRLKDDHIP